MADLFVSRAVDDQLATFRVDEAHRDAYEMLAEQRAHYVRRLEQSRGDVVEFERGIASIDAALRRLEDPKPSWEPSA